MKPFLWIDNFSHHLVASGELQDLIQNQHITGLTSNPTILAQAIKYDEYYQQKLMQLSRLTAHAKYDDIVFPDISAACDLFLPVYKKTKCHDGFVSLELDPKYTFDVKGSISSAMAIWNSIDKPNLMIKVPASVEGIQVMEELVRNGVNVNVTLIFSLEQVKQVWEAYIRAITHRSQHGLPLNIRSVASFFISRLDTTVDPIINDTIQGKAASALGVVAYNEYLKLFSQESWKALETKGAIPQTLLWASVGVKNPQYSTTKYVEELYFANTIFTLPPALIKAMDNKQYQLITTKDKASKAEEQLNLVNAELKLQHKNIAKITTQLFDDGVASFKKSFEDLMARLN